jgi:hypothetical protein
MSERNSDGIIMTDYQQTKTPVSLEWGTQCCQEAETPARKVKRGREKKRFGRKIRGRILAEFYKNGRKEAGENFLKKFLIKNSTDKHSGTKTIFNFLF